MLQGDRVELRPADSLFMGAVNRKKVKIVNVKDDKFCYGPWC